MRIVKYGTVILTEGPVRVEDWLVEREPEDSPDLTTEQLLLGFAVPWALGRLREAVNSAALDMIREHKRQQAVINTRLDGTVDA